MKTTQQVIAGEARYQGRNMAAEVKSGVRYEEATEILRRRWAAICAKSKWDFETSWTMVSDAYYDAVDWDALRQVGIKQEGSK